MIMGKSLRDVYKDKALQLLFIKALSDDVSPDTHESRSLEITS